ncbi:ZYRO0A00594p [Zygosaccharomyces rouxii]|uniref:ZYRO0A00594p n=1 Tax=Zygosaccharomyces rouxii (strain ATCC 2623 / CBS 732 / NBRC 1130 / NCYC 568 / NRRL Y-229) TaxID=559307 RepID=C5DP57_ZYGRC|nr:uncharacterized protein ZYRO0A00594g [Zygosaccharomyces rouxii]KAH9199014.1 small-subunit processome [Zygosaccharomyces rouxii]CAR25468.1 ZYRO0A00594p [Zygosaccharomyces rouxii]
MAKKKNQPSSKLRKRAQNALELAQNELGESDYSDDESAYNSGRRGVLNISRRGQDEDEFEGSENGEESFEDEDLDSDEALGSDDEYDVMNSKFSQTIRDKQKNKNRNQEPEGDSDEEYTSIDEADLLPLSAVWDKAGNDDDDGDSSSGAEENSNGKLELQNENEIDGDDDDDDDEGDESESSQESGSEENPFDEVPQDDDDEVELNNVTSGLMKEGDKQEYKRLNNYGTGKENEYALPSATSVSGSNKLNLADMIGVVDDKEAAAKATLVQDNSSTLSVPLPQRIQQRHERKAAYEISKDEMDKWKDVVQQNRRAEHLDFASGRSVPDNTSSTFTRSAGQPQTELEEKVDKVLQNSNLVDPVKNSTFEELATAKMSPEDMKKKTREMRLMRELMFREERKAKRLKKIKSKTYRRIKKKEMLKNRELAGVDEESDEDADVARAKERMTLKHRANSKWAKEMVKHGMTNDAETREEMEEMLRQGERLNTKVLDHDSEEDDPNLSDIEREEEKEQSQGTSGEKLGKSGIMDMAFMKTAEAREKDENRKTMEALRAAEVSGNVDEESDDEKAANVELNQGRRIYNSVASVNSKQERAKKSGDKPNGKKQVKDGEVEVRYEEPEQQEARNGKESEDKKTESVNPWLATGDEEDESTVKHSSKVSVVDKDSTKAAKNLYKIEKKGKRNSKAADADEDLLLDADDQHHMTFQTEDLTPNFMFKQQDVVAEAFAGDDVVTSFDDDKKRVAESEDDKEEDVTLPGWGQWAGAGSNPKKKRKFVKKIKGTVEKNKRKDKNLQNVIINEKLNKKNLKYQSSAVPFPFESKEQYERSLRMPLGSEWTSSSAHQKMIKPRILTKPSEVIDPLKAPFK